MAATIVRPLAGRLSIRAFCADTSGFATVEWVFTSGMVVALGLATMFVLGSGLQGGAGVLRTGLAAPIVQDSFQPTLLNASFEPPADAIDAPWGYRADHLPGWTEHNGLAFEFVHAATIGQSLDGHHALDMEASPGNLVISQTVPDLRPGGEYSLSFNAADPVGDNQVEVWWNGTYIGATDTPGQAMSPQSFALVQDTGDRSGTLMLVGTGPLDGAGVHIDALAVR